MAKTIDIINKRFGRLLALKVVGRTSDRYKQFLIKVKCDCGTEKIIRKGALLAGNTVSCGCYWKEQIKKSNSIEGDNATKNILLHNYKTSAKRKNIEFSLSKEQFYLLIEQHCHYCRCPPNRDCKGIYFRNRGILYIGIDRKDNSIGYTLNNSVPCCKTCNYAKHNQSYEEFIKYLKRVAKVWS